MDAVLPLNLRLGPLGEAVQYASHEEARQGAKSMKNLKFWTTLLAYRGNRIHAWEPSMNGVDNKPGCHSKAAWFSMRPEPIQASFQARLQKVQSPVEQAGPSNV
jgi:hypothetical protein